MAWWKYAKPGDKIVCLRSDWDWVGFDIDDKPNSPEEREVCTVVEVFDLRDGYGPYVSVSEYPDDQCFEAWNFRPIDPASKKADRGIAALHDLLNEQPVRKPERERV